MNSNEQIYQKYLENLKADIITRYEAQGRRASGDYADQIEGVTTEKSMKLIGAAHSVFVEKGRGPGRFPPPQSIKEWIEVKQGLPQVFKEKPDVFAYLIGRKIAQQGTAGSDILEPVFQEFVERQLPVMLKELGDAYAVRIKNDIVRLIKKFTK